MSPDVEGEIRAHTQAILMARVDYHRTMRTLELPRCPRCKVNAETKNTGRFCHRCKRESRS